MSKSEEDAEGTTALNPENSLLMEMSINICLSTFSILLFVSFLIVVRFCLKLEEFVEELVLDLGDFCTQTIFEVRF